MTDSPPEPPGARRRAYKIAGPQTWGLARELYLAGLPAKEVARRLDVSEHNLRKKAWREGWSRRKHAETVLDLKLPAVGGDRRTLALGGEAQAPFTPPEPEPPGEADPADAADILARRAAAASLAGRVQEALALLKTAEALRRAAEAARAAEPAFDDEDDWPADDEDPLAGVSPEELEKGIERLNRNLGLGPWRRTPLEPPEGRDDSAP